MSRKKLLEKYNDIISSLYVNYIKIKSKKKGKTELWQSKFAGSPYLPKNKKHPLTKKGEHLYLLAQINFEEMPELHPFPQKGLLQFWIYPTIYQGVNLDDR
ncbi:MAG TPA: YwqG family protein, partial [Leptospiraceae bacterium]|nr:YwqG family protein [Leptospiraceae bacterium]